MATIISAYAVKRKVGLDCSGDPVLVEQAHKQEVDINNILRRYIKTGLFEYRNKHEASYGDVPATDFQTAMQIVAQGNTMFEELPSTLRQKFKTPADFFSFVHDEKNMEQLYELGLATRPRPESSPGEVSPPVDKVG